MNAIKKHREMNFFDYDLIDPSIRGWLKKMGEEIRRNSQETIARIFRLGRMLEEVRERIHEEPFCKWVEPVTGIPRSTAYHYIRVFRQCGHLEGSGLHNGVLYVLAAKNTPQQVKDEIFDLVESGHTVMPKDARQLKLNFLRDVEESEEAITGPIQDIEISNGNGEQTTRRTAATENDESLIDEQWEPNVSKNSEPQPAPSRRPPNVVGQSLDSLDDNPKESSTPKPIVDLVLELFQGRIDLDPCSNRQRIVPAQRHVSLSENGLDQDWRGRVYVFPPPTPQDLFPWVEHLFEEYRKSHVTEAVLLAPSWTDAAWFPILAEFPRCFLRERVVFGAQQAPFAMMAVYLGLSVERFIQVFSEIGHIYAQLHFQFSDRD